ncbi:MAG: hypothetical protein RL687_148 [Candidatus Parcubacteria bacterium]
MKKVLFFLSLSVLGTGIKSCYSAPAATGSEIFIDSIIVGKNSISVYGECSVVNVHTHIAMVSNGVFLDGDTMDTYGLTHFVLRSYSLSPGTPYLIKITVKDYSGTDTITIGSITTLSGNGWNNSGGNGALKIRNQSLIRFAGSVKVELRGIIELSPKSTAVAYAAIFSDSLCKNAIAPVSTRLNYSNVNNFSSISSLYYNFNIDTSAHNVVWGKFWGSDNLGNSVEDPASVGVKVLMPKTTGILDYSVKKNIFIYPVPTVDFLFLEFICSYIITDIMGREVKNGRDSKINVGDLPVGYYLVNTDLGSARFWKN